MCGCNKTKEQVAERRAEAKARQIALANEKQAPKRVQARAERRKALAK